MKTIETKEAQTLKGIVQQKYSQIAEQSGLQSGCCGTECCTEEKEAMVEQKEEALSDSACCDADCCGDAVMAENYSTLEGYVSDADLGLGCGLPTEFAQLKPGDTVIDLGSGAGNDGFVARAIVGETGRVVGVDFTEKMIEKARRNAEKLGYKNVEFRLGDIEDLPVRDNFADVVVSNCVMNLVPDKARAFSETYRVLKPGGHFSISDIVIKGHLPQTLQQDAEMYVGCVAGASLKEEYLQIIEKAGFQHITIQKERKISLPAALLEKYLSTEEIEQFKSKERGVFSITVYAEKPII